jgi:hypothetical protein
MRVSLLALGLAIAGGIVAAACGGETDTTFGPPNGIVGKSAPTVGSTSGSSSGSGSGSSSSGSSSGTASGGGDGGGSGGGDGGGGGEGGVSANCTVSWSGTIFPYFESTGQGTCGTQLCHGGTNAPTIVDGNAATTFTNLTTYTINGLNYIATGNTNPASSAIECNIGITTPACGIAQMPEAPGTLNATARTNITTWLACGAPNN